MQNKLPRIAKLIVPTLFWLLIWEISALLLNFPYFLPDISLTLKALCKILCSAATYKILALTFLRVILSIAISSVFGIALAVISHRFDIVRIFLSPLISVMKSVPVAIFSVLFYVLIRSDVIPILIAFFMIMPVIWQNLMDGYDSIDKNLYEVCLAYEFSYRKKLTVLVFPALIKFFVPALITSVGFSWKAVISSEILVRTADSVGKIISDSKFYMDTAATFAWTFIALVLSISLEKLVKYLLRRCKL